MRRALSAAPWAAFKAGCWPGVDCPMRAIRNAGFSDFLRKPFEHLPRISDASLYIPFIRDGAVQ